MRLRSPADVAAAVRENRKRQGLSQADLARLAGVSRRWLVDLEAGKPRAELALVLAVLRSLDLSLTVGQVSGPAEPSSAPALVDLDEHLRRIAEPG